jgi:hypothetical protein
LKLIRLAILTFDTDPGLWGKAESQFGDIRIERPFYQEDGGKYLIGVAAIVPLRFRPKRTKSGLIVLPRRPREMAESVIEHHANLISVAMCARHNLSSVYPEVAMLPEGAEDEGFLSKCVGFLHPGGNTAVPDALFTLEPEDVKHLHGRLDGVALLAEGLAGTGTGPFRDFIRLFERAFALGGRAMVEPLANFLSASGQGYSRPEIAKWLDMRAGVTHADKRNEILFRGDVAWLTPRLRQAAFDVLLNKNAWRSPDLERRSTWSPAVGTSSPDADMFGVRGREWRFQYAIFDSFRRFPLHLKASLARLPKGWWTAPLTREKEQHGIISGQLDVR